MAVSNAGGFPGFIVINWTGLRWFPRNYVNHRLDKEGKMSDGENSRRKRVSASIKVNKHYTKSERLVYASKQGTFDKFRQVSLQKITKMRYKLKT